MTVCAVAAPVGFIYGIRLRDELEYRYIGLTTATVPKRLQQHLKCAREGKRTPLYDWMRKHADAAFVADELDVLFERELLGESEQYWIGYLRRQGDRLLNVSDGGLGPTGIVWTPEQREAARLRSTGRKGVSRPGAANPFFGKKHSAEQRASWTISRQGTNTGADNANFGKFGAEHPGFGHTMSAEARQALSESRMGALNPNYGKKASDETRAKMSAVRKGRPMPSSKRSAHTRYHTNKGVVSPTCTYCVEDAEARRNGGGEGPNHG